MSVVEDAVEERIKGGRPGWLRAVIAAIVIGAVAAIAAFRLLRSGSDDDDDES
jgi:hypothetical protein